MSSTETLLQNIAEVLYQNQGIIHKTSTEIDACVSILNALSACPEIPLVTPRLCKTILCAGTDAPESTGHQYRVTTSLLANPSRETLVGIGYNNIRDAFSSFCQVAPLTTDAGCLRTLSNIHFLFGDQLLHDVRLRKTWRLLTATLRNAVECGGSLAPEMTRVLTSLDCL